MWLRPRRDQGSEHGAIWLNVSLCRAAARLCPPQGGQHLCFFWEQYGTQGAGWSVWPQTQRHWEVSSTAQKSILGCMKDLKIAPMGQHYLDGFGKTVTEPKTKRNFSVQVGRSSHPKVKGYSSLQYWGMVKWGVLSKLKQSVLFLCKALVPDSLWVVSNVPLGRRMTDTPLWVPGDGFWLAPSNQSPNNVLRKDWKLGRIYKGSI